jgi:hypothetical protein
MEDGPPPDGVGERTGSPGGTGPEEERRRKMASRKRKEAWLRNQGPGLRYLSNEKWYGPGYCGICGTTRDIIARPTRFWDPDDGWRVGVLCVCCTRGVRDRGPQPEDYAYRRRDDAGAIDAAASVSDADGVYSIFG